MDYLRRYHAADIETMALVAKHFSVYREWALHLEQSARSRLQPLRGKTVPSEYIVCCSATASKAAYGAESVCLQAYLKNHISKFYQIFSACSFGSVLLWQHAIYSVLPV